jgi:peptide subunit release factor 1 (eRF1)
MRRGCWRTAAELVLAQFEGRCLLPSGALELRNAVMQYLPKHTRQSVGSEFSVEVHEEPADVAAAAAPVQREIEAREEVVTVQRLIDAGPDRSAWDVQPTLSALHLGRVMTLVVDNMFCQAGMRCRNCGGLWEQPSNRCPLCESDAIETVEDVVELAIERALDESSSLEIVRSGAARRLLALIGPMAALLRW